MNLNVNLSNELEQFLHRTVENAVSSALLSQKTEIPKPENLFAYSIQEAANHFKCSPVTFQRWKNEGRVAYTQYGRKLIIDLIATLELLGQKKGLKK